MILNPRLSFWIALVLVLAVSMTLPTSSVVAQPPGPSLTPNPATTSEPTSAASAIAPVIESKLQFNFAGAPWSDVLRWFAEESNLSLQMNTTPEGTLNFVDPDQRYSIAEGLDLINRLLLDRGWALVRRGRILLLVDLEADNAEKLISEMAELVSPEDFVQRGNSDIVRAVFSIGGLEPEKAREELSQIIGPWGRVNVLAGARQVIVTETVGKLKAIQTVLEAANQAQSNVVDLQLKHRAAEEVLEIARPLLGLEPGQNLNDSIRISVSLYGDRIFATGDQVKLGLLQRIMEKADTPMPGDGDEQTELIAAVLKTHLVNTADLQTTFDVLQTLLAGTPDARLAIDTARGALIVSARPETQTLVEKTIAELEGDGKGFAIVDLKRLEPAQALLTINKFFGVTADGTGQGPVVDGDPTTGRLWVRGTTQQVETVKKLIADLENDPLAGGLGENVRILPLTGAAANDMLEQIESLWPMTGRPNRLRVITPSAEQDGTSVKRQPTLNPAGDDSAANRTRGSDRQDGSVRLVAEVNEDDENANDGNATTSNADSDAPDPVAIDPMLDPDFGSEVIVKMTPAGLVIASRDTKALDLVEQLAASLGTSSSMNGDMPIIFWLKYIKADIAAELIAGVLGGAESAGSSGGSLAESVVGGLGGGMLGGLLGMGGGGDGDSSVRSILTSRGSVNIVPDNRLNALIVQAAPADLDFIRLVLQEIDRQESPEDIQTIAKPNLIPVVYQEADAVANIVKAVFAEKIGSPEGGGRQASAPSPQDLFAALRGGRGGGGGGEDKPKSEATKIIVAVDARSNSLVVTATPQDFAMVRDLVETLDQQGLENETSVEVIALGGKMRPEVMQQALESVLGKKTSTATASSSASSSSSTPSSSSSSSSLGGSSPEDIQRRIEFFRSRFGGGGGGPPSGFGGRGGGDSGGRGGSGGGRSSGRGGR